MEITDLRETNDRFKLANINKGVANIFFAGDHHLYHDFMVTGALNEDGTPALKEDGTLLAPPPRPMFSSVEEMTETIIVRHNEVVSRGDIVYAVGDFALKCSLEQARKARRRMNGNFYLVEGNHDQIAVKIPEEFVWIKQLARIKPKGHGEVPPIVLCHYAMRVWHGSHKGTWHLYGHSHGQLPEIDHSLSYDVGLDTSNFYPTSIQQVIDRMAQKKPIWEEWKRGLNKTGGVGL